MAIDRKAKSCKITCSMCQQERYVTHPQSWNIKVGNCSGKCLKCSAKNKVSLTQFKKGQASWNKGLNISGMSGKRQSEKQKKIKSLLNKIDPIAEKPGVREKMRLAKLGKRKEQANNWKDGRSYKGQNFRRTVDYKIWRQEVLRKFNFKCSKCSSLEKKLEVHHILPYATHVGLRTDLSNGVALCHSCHREVEKLKKQDKHAVSV